MLTSTHRQNLPNIDHLSVLAAMIVLAYTLARIINLPGWQISRQLPGLYIELTVDMNLITTVIVACMTFSSAYWLMSSHPAAQGRQGLVHSILPALTALAVGIPLRNVPVGVGWWIGLISGAIILVLVLIAEYIAIDSQDDRFTWATAGLSAVSFALFLLFAGAMRAGGVRLLFNVPALAVAAWLVSVRVTNVRLHGEWTVYESAIIAFLVAQVTAAFNYWPLTPAAFGLVLLGPSYALISLFCNLIEEKPFKGVIVEPIISIVIAWGAAFIFR